ncbi:hypothetical protein [Fusicatenibacter sp.]
MNQEIKNIIETTTDMGAQYDACAKRILGQKIILAHILVKTVDEFYGMNPKVAALLIEGQPYISKVPIDPGLTNHTYEKNGERIVGLNTENQELNEGLIRFDIIFYVRMRDGLSQIIINIEAQRGDPSEYDILNRATFYASRMISSQKERDFKNSNYDDIERIYSIWICMDWKENCMNYFHLTDEPVLGSYHWKGKRDLINIVMIGLGKTLPEQSEEYDLHRLLGALLSKELSVERKSDIIEEEYSIPMEQELGKEVKFMGSLSDGIREEAFAKGITEGLTKGRAEGESEIIRKLYQKGCPMEQIVLFTDKSEDEVRAIIEGKTLELV